MSKLAEPAPYVVAAETAVVDYHYPAISQYEDLKQEFLSSIPRLVSELGRAKDFPWLVEEAPRGGDMRMVPAELLDDLLVHFANAADISHEDYFPVHTFSNKDNAQRARDVLFGTPKLHAGGSTANTFDAMINSRVNGQALFDGDFVTAVGNDEAGEYFIEAHKGHIRAEKAGVQMVCHVIPVGKDRIMLTAPSFANPSGDYFDLPNQLNDDTLDKADIVMIGGFLHFTKDMAGFRSALRIVDNYATVKERPESKAPLTRIITLAQQQIAEQNPVPLLLGTSKAYGATIIHGNTGEFRRAMSLDTDWREPYVFEDPAGQKLDGTALENAKKAHPEYQAAKVEANRVASEAAHDIAKQVGNLSFVATNSHHPARVINKDEILIHATPSLDKNQVKSTVGAGDNHVAGYWIGKRLGKDEKGCLEMASAFARAVIQIPEARLPRTERAFINGTLFEGPIAVVARQNPELFEGLPNFARG